MLRRTLLLLTAIVSPVAFAGNQNPHFAKFRSSLPTGRMNEVYPDQLMIKLRGIGDISQPQSPLLKFARVTPRPPIALETSISRLLRGGEFVSEMDHGGWTIWHVPVKETLKAARADLAGVAEVSKVEPVNRVYHLDLPAPNDPDIDYLETSDTYVLDLDDSGGADFLRTWHLRDDSALLDDTTGYVSGGWATFPGVWYTALTKPRSTPTIAFVDTGLDLNHPDFVNAGGRGPDVTQGGQLDLSRSAYFLNGQIVPGTPPMDENGHGSHVAGIAIAAGNNGSFDTDGTIGIGYNSQGMILRVFDSNDNASDANAAAAIEYAADNGADIINLSLGTTNFSTVFQEAVTYAYQKGSLVVCAGNENGSGGGDLGPIYPAACSGALAVTANGPEQISADDNYAGYGSYVGMAAPGGDLVTYSETELAIQYVFSTATEYDCSLSENSQVQPPYTLDYTYLVGTSMACPNVSGAAGLYYGQNYLRQYQGFSNVKAYQALEATADPSNGVSDGGWEPTQGYGSLDVQSLLSAKSVPNPRGATVGSLIGIVYYNTTPIANVAVNAIAVNGSGTFQTTTLQDGTYRFDGLPGNQFYTVSCAPFGASKSRVVWAPMGSDYTGEDFFCGTVFDDTTPPVVPIESFLGSTTNSLDINQWAYDPETEIDTAKVAIGTTYGGSDVMAPTPIYPGATHLHLAGFSLPRSYYVTSWYTNGAGMVSHALVTNSVCLADGYVADGSAANTEFQNGYLDVSAGATGQNQVSYIEFGLSSALPNIKNAFLSIWGSATSPMPVSVYATNASTITASTLTYNNSPAITGSAVATVTVPTHYSNFRLDVTSVIKSARASGAKMVVFALANGGSSSATTKFTSRLGSPGLKPVLNISSSE